MACGGREGSREGGGREEIWGGRCARSIAPYGRGHGLIGHCHPPGRLPAIPEICFHGRKQIPASAGLKP